MPVSHFVKDATFCQSICLPELEVDALHGGLGDHVPLAPGLGDGHGGGGGKGGLTNENRVLRLVTNQRPVFRSRDLH